MYHAILANRYLTSRVIPLIAVAAVALCVALVIIVVSVMTGFLDMVRASGRTLMGDVIVQYAVTGIPEYEKLIERIEALDSVEAATPVVDGWGLLRMPYPLGDAKETETVQVWGIDAEGFGRVTHFSDTLYWKTETPETLGSMRADDIRRTLNKADRGTEGRTRAMIMEDQGRTLQSADGKDAMVIGIHVSVANERMKDGSIQPAADGYWLMPNFEVTLTTMPVDSGGGLSSKPKSERFPIVNEFASGVFLIDETRIMIPLAAAQSMLSLDEHDIVDQTDLDEVTGLPRFLGVGPARATMVLVRAKSGFTPEVVRDQAKEVYESFYDDFEPDALVRPPPPWFVSINTWEQQQAKFIGPIEKEREVMRTLFSLVYLVCAGLVLAIFWAIVFEKTRDIGILRSVGASRLGISWIFIRYGLVIGVAGAFVGLGLSILIVRHINEIHTAMGDPPFWLVLVSGASALTSIVVTALMSRRGHLFPLALGSLVTLTLIGVTAVIYVVRSIGGLVIWDATVYYFSVIPNAVDYGSAVFTMIGAVLFSLIGAFLPAAKAADTDPVRALRYE